MNTSRGFTPIIILLLVAVLAAASFGGYKYAEKKGLNIETLFNAATSTPSVSEKMPETASNASVKKIDWLITLANPTITDDNDYHKYEQKIGIKVTLANSIVNQYELGTAYGCADKSQVEVQGDRKVFGLVSCYMALSGTSFIAYSQRGQFVVERNDESAKDGSLVPTRLLNLPQPVENYQAEVTVVATYNGFLFYIPTTWSYSPEPGNQSVNNPLKIKDEKGNHIATVQCPMEISNTGKPAELSKNGNIYNNDSREISGYSVSYSEDVPAGPPNHPSYVLMVITKKVATSAGYLVMPDTAECVIYTDPSSTKPLSTSTLQYLHQLFNSISVGRDA